MSLKPLYETELGKAFHADSLKLLPTLPDASIDLVLTSPPYALHFKKEYGNADQAEYVEWFMPFAREIRRVLKPAVERDEKYARESELRFDEPDPVAPRGDERLLFDVSG